MSKYLRDVGKCGRGELIGGTKVPIITSTKELEDGQGVLKRGAILGKVTSSKKFKLVDDGASDGSQIANCILVHDVDTDVDTVATCYISGQFNANYLHIKDDGDVLAHEDELRDVNIYITMEV